MSKRKPAPFPPLSAVVAERCRRSLARFVVEAWPQLEPARPIVPAWHTDAIADHLEAFARGQIKRLLITIPPGVGKSTLSTALQPWVWLWRPAWRLITASYAHSLAVRDSVRVRDVVRSGWYRENFAPDWTIRTDQDTKADIANTAGGRRLATSVGAGTTGWRGDALLIDDALAAGDAGSRTAKDEVWRWFGSTMTSRLDDPGNASICVVGQRLAEDDLPGRLIGEPGWEALVLPSLSDGKRRATTYITLTDGSRSRLFVDPRAESDVPLFPAMFPREVLDRAKREMGSAAFAAQHQQDPQAEGTGMFARGWWRFWRQAGTASDLRAPRPQGCWDGPAVPLPAGFDTVLVSVDCTFKANDSSDYVVATVWGAKQKQYFLLDMVRRRLTFTQTLDMLRTLAAKWPTSSKLLIEEAANGSAVLDVLRREIDGVVGVLATESKEARASSISPLCEAGQVFLPDGAPFVDDAVHEAVAFPRGRHDDFIDSMSMALRELSARSGWEDFDLKQATENIAAAFAFGHRLF